ncbi:Zinc finger C2H2-type/integrase DNA-binding domain [Penicillium roqueforti FM164]|uniref:Zinc finger C2H2-type/integrase DNA-binding domain n=1 Tax=Penicillium roqueforti (strain FM164) TaxID=1365484 RepID=W6QPV1_PENRF|nr:Zinc finger C2H2-type/integrase DNA-binding domain [Penicillium roqueforti FM164]
MSCSYDYDFHNSDLCRLDRTYTNERPYNCNAKDCGESLAQRNTLTACSQTHCVEKPNICDHQGCDRVVSDMTHPSPWS